MMAFAKDRAQAGYAPAMLSPEQAKIVFNKYLRTLHLTWETDPSWGVTSHA